MNKLIASLIFIALAISCQKALKDVNDYFPVVNTISATVQPDGTVLVKGEIESEGAAPVEYFGFCCGTLEQPELLDRQLIAETWDGQFFSATYTGFEPDSTYYFRAWATNDYGYVYSDIILPLANIIAAPVIAPCSVSLNTCAIGGGQPVAEYYTVSAPTASIGQWEITATTATGPVVNLIFGSSVTTGIYSTVNYNSPAAGQVFVSFYSGPITGSLNEGSKVYVNRIGTDIYEIAICDAPWVYNGGSPLYFRTRFRSPS